MRGGAGGRAISVSFGDQPEFMTHRDFYARTRMPPARDETPAQAKLHWNQAAIDTSFICTRVHPESSSVVPNPRSSGARLVYQARSATLKRDESIP